MIAISCLCREESLRGLKDPRHSTPSQRSMGKKIATVGAMAPAPLSFKTQGGGGGSGGSIQGPGPAEKVRTGFHC